MNWQWGDMVSSVATPIATTLRLDCVDPATQQLRPESRCGQWSNSLNQFGQAMYDKYWAPKEDDGV